MNSNNLPPRSEDELIVIRVTEKALDTLTNPLKSVTIYELAFKAGMSTSKFRQLFGDIYNVSVRRFFTQYVISKAKVMLQDMNTPIKVVSKNLDYTPPAFIRLFRNKTGITPSRYRANFYELTRSRITVPSKARK